MKCCLFGILIQTFFILRYSARHLCRLPWRLKYPLRFVIEPSNVVKPKMILSKHGFEDEQFETAVQQSLHCSICGNVFKQPVMCRRNQHIFCHTCITEHLNNSRTCPLCSDELTVEALSEAPRILTDTLSELKIRCDYFKRGCREVMQLGDLEHHVKDCGFVAVVCSNEGCRAEINKRDRIHHETEVCEFRKVQCHNCAEMGEKLAQLAINLEDIKVNLREIKEQVRGNVQTAQEKMMKDSQAATNVEYNVIVAGGDDLNSVEAFSLEERSWTPMKPMKNRRKGASSFVYNHQLGVAGGLTKHGLTDDMEVMNVDPVACSTPWLGGPAKLHTKLYGHKSVVYNDRLITVGGYDGDRVTDSIHEDELLPPYTSKMLTSMHLPRFWHGMELFQDKVFIVGGRKNWFKKDAMASVMMYDINKNECKQMRPLPFAMCGMATVSWGDNVIIIGGADRNGKTLDTVVIYNVKTEKSHTLPEMKCKRKGCAAVVAGNTIVVIGGSDEKGGNYESVEEFSFNRYSWEYLPPMSEARLLPAVVAI